MGGDTSRSYVDTSPDIIKPMKKIALIVGTRPEVIKLAPLYLELKKSKTLKPILINTGQHLEMTAQMLKWFGIKEDYNLKLMSKNQTLADITARVISELSKTLEKIKPDLVIVEGDTVTVMASSIAAFYLKIPVAHVEAGLRTEDIYNPFPEEMARRLVSRIAKYHFAPTKLALENLKKEGVTKNVFMTGNTVIDALLYTKNKIKEKEIKKHFKDVDFKKKKVILVTMHRRENLGKPHKDIAKTLVKITNTFKDTLVLLPIHKNPKVREVLLPILEKNKNIIIVEPLDYVPFIYAMNNSYLILSDSGGVQEEAPSLNKPVLVLRTNTERPEGIKAGAAKLVGTDPERIFSEVSKLFQSKSTYLKMAKTKNPYGDGDSSKKIVRILENIDTFADQN